MYDLQLCTLHTFSVTKVLKDTGAMSASASSTMQQEQISWLKQLVLRALCSMPLGYEGGGEITLALAWSCEAKAH